MASPVRRFELTDQNTEPLVPKKSPWRALGRLLRVLVALPLLALSAWVLLPFAVVPVSIVAVTNTRISWVRNQAAGQVLRFHVDVGDRVTPGQELVDIGTVSGDSKGTAEELLKKKSDLEIQDTALRAQIAETDQRLRVYESEVHEYTARMAAETELRLRQASRELDSARVSAQELKQVAGVAPKNEDLMEIDREIARLEDSLAELRERYNDNHPDIQRVRSQLSAVQRRRAAAAKVAPSAPPVSNNAQEQAVLAKEIETKTGLVERLRAQLANLQAGYFVGPEQEHPPVLARRDEAAAALGKLREQRLILSLQQKAILAQLATVPAAPTNAVTTIRSTVEGVVWSRDVPSGQTIRESEDLIRIAETDSVQVEAYLDGRYAQRLSIGDRAMIDLTSLNKSISGRLISIQAPAQRKADAEPYAIDLKPPVEGLYHVMVQVDPADRGIARVGQVARVLFPGPDGSLIARVYSWMNRI